MDFKGEENPHDRSGWQRHVPAGASDWLCIVSPAVPNHHPDLRAARRLGVEVLLRAEAVALLLAKRETICVAGSHGKSTTAAMLA